MKKILIALRNALVVSTIVMLITVLCGLILALLAGAYVWIVETSSQYFNLQTDTIGVPLMGFLMIFGVAFIVVYPTE
jgi:ABC-type dipeptide/oligopeptide/nickel transport system permease subunit